MASFSTAPTIAAAWTSSNCREEPLAKQEPLLVPEAELPRLSPSKELHFRTPTALKTCLLI